MQFQFFTLFFLKSSSACLLWKLKGGCPDKSCPPCENPSPSCSPPCTVTNCPGGDCAIDEAELEATFAAVPNNGTVENVESIVSSYI